jgi:hypothetical protein
MQLIDVDFLDKAVIFHTSQFESEDVLISPGNCQYKNTNAERKMQINSVLYNL